MKAVIIHQGPLFCVKGSDYPYEIISVKDSCSVKLDRPTQ